MVKIKEWPIDEVFESFDDARNNIVSKEDSVTFYNPNTRRPLKNYNNFDTLMMYYKNTRLGYHGIALLVTINNDVKVAYYIFDQNGEMTVKELWDNEPWGDW